MNPREDLQEFMTKMPLACIFYARFDITVGAVVDYQYPKDVFHKEPISKLKKMVSTQTPHDSVFSFVHLKI